MANKNVSLPVLQEVEGHIEGQYAPAIHKLTNEVNARMSDSAAAGLGPQDAAFVSFQKAVESFTEILTKIRNTFTGEGPTINNAPALLPEMQKYHQGMSGIADDVNSSIGRVDFTAGA